jgi:hypothetical protein
MLPHLSSICGRPHSTFVERVVTGVKNESPPHRVETRGRGLREIKTLSLFAAARHASSTRHSGGSRELRCDLDERLASFDFLMFSSGLSSCAEHFFQRMDAGR